MNGRGRRGSAHQRWPGDNGQVSESTTQRTRGDVPHIRRLSGWQRVWQPFWTLPAALSLAAFVLGILLPEVDRDLRELVLWVFPGGADAARGALTTIASVTISTVGVVFSITMVVLQLAAGEFTPRVLGDFLSNRIVQWTFGMFIATFLFALLVLRSVVSEDEEVEGFVPRVSVSFAFLLVLTCVALFLAFIRSITEAIQVSAVISRIGDRTMQLIDRVVPGGEEYGTGPTWSPAPDAPRVRVHVDDRHGHVDEVDARALVELAAGRDGVLVLEQNLGDFTTKGQLLATFWGEDWDDDASRAANRAVRLSTNRSLHQDVTFGFRQLVDIADRALSPGVNDPTTATQVVDELHRLLRELVQRVSPSPYVADADGAVRLVMQPPSVDAILEVYVNEVAYYARDSRPVPRRLVEMLDDLTGCALPRYEGTLRELSAALSTEDPAPAGQE